MIWVVHAKFSRWSLTWIRKIKILIKHQNDAPVSWILRLSYFFFFYIRSVSSRWDTSLNCWIQILRTHCVNKRGVVVLDLNATALKLVMGFQSKLAGQDSIDELCVYMKHSTWMYKMKNCWRFQLSILDPHMLVHRCVTRWV